MWTCVCVVNLDYKPLRVTAGAAFYVSYLFNTAKYAFNRFNSILVENILIATKIAFLEGKISKKSQNRLQFGAKDE